MKRVKLSDADCPVARALDVVGDWWSLLIVRDVFDGIHRFSALQKSLGVARGMLAARLRTLGEGGVLESVTASDGSAYQEYVLTQKGRELFPVILALRQWGEDHLFAPGERHSVLIDRETRQPIGRVRIETRDGRRLRPEETEVRKVPARKNAR